MKRNRLVVGSLLNCAVLAALTLSLGGCLANSGNSYNSGADGPSNQRSACISCGGSGRCNTCNGTGRFLGSGQTGCSTCSSSGVCINCGGRGR